MRKIPFALAAALLVLAAPVLADDDDGEENEWLRSGWYVSLDGSYNFQDITNVMGSPVDDSLGAGIRAGWHFAEYFAAEIEFQWVNGFDFGGMQPLAPFAGLDYWLWTFGLNGRAYLPIPVDSESFWNRIQPYLLGGFGLQQWTPGGGAIYPPTGTTYDGFDTEGSFYGKLGGGLDLYITKNWALGFEASYVIPVSETALGHSLRYVETSWNFIYRF